MSFLKRLLSITAILLPFFSFAQGYYKPGFVVNLKGDTLHGYIDLREWGSNPISVNFKTTLSDSPQKFTASDISYFEVPKIAAYKAYTTSITLDPTNIERIERFRDTATKTADVFLKVIQRGKNVILYNYVDDIKERFYIYDDKTKSLAELIYRLYFIENDINHVTTVSQDGYKQQLLLIAQQYDTYNEDLSSLLSEAEYRKIDLMSICRKINGTSKK